MVTDAPAQASYILTMTCPDRTGIVAAMTGALAGEGCFVTEAAYFADPDSDIFFGRAAFRITRPGASIETVGAAFSGVADEFDMDWTLNCSARKQRVMILVSKADHCLSDLLYRYRGGTLAMEVTAIASNHQDLKPLAEWHGIPFHHLPITPETKADQEAKLLALIAETKTDIVVLARYMQILSPETCRALRGRVINIHHSFLPGFVGAKPYHQAHARGVKLIGATAHFVTEDLDGGPIIEQEIQRVDHTFTAEDLIAMGRDAENRALSRALKYVLERRVLLNGKRTVVFK